MSLNKSYAADHITISFELFPPKTEKGIGSLFRHVEQLMNYQPDFITCTYGAGGTTRGTTLEIVKQVKQRFGVPVASHLTLVESTIDQLRDFLDEAHRVNVDYIVALRGDPPQGETTFQPAEGGLQFANELVELVRSEFAQFGVAVAGYPETHREASSSNVDLENLKRKVDAGADVVLTQLFYDNRDYFSFLDRCRNAGISVPIIPGILPISSLSQVERITALCGSKLPAGLTQQLSRNEDEDWQRSVGVEYAVSQVQELVDAGVDGLHFYVLNKSRSTSEILDAADLGDRARFASKPA